MLDMTDPAGHQHDEALHQFVHDVKHCLHLAGMGMEILKGVRDNEARFEEICDMMDKQHKESLRLLDDFLGATCAGCE